MFDYMVLADFQGFNSIWEQDFAMTIGGLILIIAWPLGKLYYWAVQRRYLPYEGKLARFMHKWY